ncbi:MAG TPA: folylpolyglutamate synthase/dihydrofolate synthase family protein [Chitinophagaceae bacterium]|nr:folylpolyglutamate synthase/dihydrofolate synthase family protein [Chitinophagaceae bacterium]
MFSRIGNDAIKKDLTNTRLLCQHLGAPQARFRSIHVAGTNGKGSVSHMLSAILQTAGCRTGLYTSPHLYDFRERIKINGEMVPQDFVVQFTERMQPLIETLQPSFFEVTVAMAFQYFAEQMVDVAVIETGLGGRLDSTNIIVPELSVITNISLDHTSILGNTVEEIAAEKGGIIKKKVPVVIGEKIASTEAVFTKIADEQEAPLVFTEDDFQVLNKEWVNDKLKVVITHKSKQHTNSYATDLVGGYQAKNVATVLSAVEQLRRNGWKIADDQVKEGLQQVKKLTGFHGRWEVLRKEPLLVLDVAHNEGGFKALVEQLEKTSYHQLHMVLGMAKDKDIEKMLRLLPKDALYYFTQAHIPRAVDKHHLHTMASAYKLEGLIFEDVNTAVRKALDSAVKEDLIVVCGSIFLIAEVDRLGFENA